MRFECYRCHQSVSLRGECGCEDKICLIRADCRDVLPWLEDGAVDLVLTDPPYGIEQSDYRKSLPDTKGRVYIEEIVGDCNNELAAWIIEWVMEKQIDAVIWGALNWPNLLPHKGRWICWDKRCDERADRMLGSAFEMAWTNRTSGFDEMCRVQHGGVVNADGMGSRRVHPTQKPVVLFTKVLRLRPKKTCVLDPFSGSGTTGCACRNLRCRCIMVEVEEKYCYVAAGRLGIPPMRCGDEKKGLGLM